MPQTLSRDLFCFGPILGWWAWLHLFRRLLCILGGKFWDCSSFYRKAYPLTVFDATPFPPFFAFSKVLGDSAFVCQTYRGLNNTTANGIPVWTFHFQHSPKYPWLPDIPEELVRILGPTHTAEIPFVLGLTKSLPAPNGTCNMSLDEMKISTLMNDAWTLMAALQIPTKSAVQWPAYQGAHKPLGINIMNLTQPGVVHYSQCKLWDAIEASLLAPIANGTKLSTMTPGDSSSVTSSTRSTSSTSSSNSANSISTASTETLIGGGSRMHASLYWGVGLLGVASAITSI